MPPRKKQKTASASSSKATAVSEPSTDFPSAALLTRALEQYPHALSLRSKEHTKAPNQLTDLDTWLTDTENGLLSKIASSQPVSKNDMTSLMKWKLSRGKSRPTLLGLVAANPESLILKATSTSLKAVREANLDLDRALLALPDACKMKGIGAATASALLTLQAPHLLPFMSDEAASFFSRTLGAIKYTDPFYKKFAAAMVAEVQQLNAESSGPDSQVWDSMNLERALFAICILKKHGQGELLDDDAPSDSLKRKRDES
ncbi:hypothetical protein C8F04DRAFT_1264386 [Mycena alexandri]|uniref:Uncharacterized protein n=1 Tax=Mycena alexandri TaxID=1745969 RepID=A0AAD6X2R1_9AGAR|nr:hypothetical protein C8F04DRAFT_1264386 [Mycena alexandri]